MTDKFRFKSLKGTKNLFCLKVTLFFMGAIKSAYTSQLPNKISDNTLITLKFSNVAGLSNFPTFSDFIYLFDQFYFLSVF